MLEPFRLMWRHRRLLVQTTLADLRARYAGSVLGLAWLVIFPLLLLSAYAAVYILVFKVRLGLFESNEYVLLIFCGLIPFLSFSEALANGTTSVSGNASLIKNTLFPIDLIPVKAVLLSQAVQTVGMALLLTALAVTGHLSAFALLLPAVWILQLLFTVGLIWVLSALHVYFRDLAQAVAVLTLLLMMVSPIAYTPDMVPESLRPFLGVNPLFYIITAYQDCLMIGQWPRANVPWVLAIMSAAMFYVGYWFFGRMKRIMADNV